MRIPILLCAALLLPALARAQSTPVVELRGAIGASNYLHADLDYIAPTMLVAARIGTPAIAVEPELALAWHATDEQFAPDVRVHNDVRFQSVGVNVIGRRPGRISPFGGGGVSFFTEHRHSDVTSAVLGVSDSRDRTAGPRAGFQAVGGVDVRVAPRLSVFGQARFEVRSLEDPGGGSVIQGFGGVAIALW